MKKYSSTPRFPSMSIGCGYLVIDVEIYSNGQPKALKALVIGVGENQMTIVKKNVL